jgi:hypothetical protein
MSGGEVMPARCGTVVTAWLEGPLEVANSLEGSSSKYTHGEVNRDRTLVHPRRQITVPMAERLQGRLSTAVVLNLRETAARRFFFYKTRARYN